MSGCRCLQVAMIQFQTQSMNPVQKVVASLLGLAMLVFGVMFSIVIIPVIVVLAGLGIGYFYWKTRALRKVMAAAMAEARTGAGVDNSVIEGEAVVIHEEREIRHLPGQ